MELPPELVSIIREFSRPSLRYWREFKEIKGIMGLYVDLLTDTEAKLRTREADQVFAAVVAFKDAYVEYHYRVGLCLHARNATLIRESNAAADMYQRKSRELRVVLYGEEEVLRREYE
jgi:hypothetical protein